MHSYIEFITVPTADTPGTLLLLHFNDKRYLIGRLSEGTTRACSERGIGLRKVSDVLLTGNTEWAHVGGLLGLILELADIKSSAKTAAEANDREKVRKISPSRQKKQFKTAGNSEQPHINVFGGPNLNHLFACSRRFIFRSGMPLNVKEIGADSMGETVVDDIEPTWKDNHILVWAMPILPSSQNPSKIKPPRVSTPRKRIYEETTDDQVSATEITENSHLGSSDELRRSIVEQMFNSSWRYDRLVPRSLLDVQGQTACFVLDSETKKMLPYTGPMPGGNDPVPDITVLAREPWPAAATSHVPPTQSAQEALSYIIRNYPQRGRFMPQKAKDFGIPEGLSWSYLAKGETVTNSRGEKITPDMVLQPGKQGGGFAVVDLPNVDYIDQLIGRPEWQSEQVMDGVEAVVWILGPGILHDERLRNFQLARSHMKHVISSPDCCPNVIALERAATNALRHNLVDEEIFPTLKWDDTASVLSHARAARPGQVVTLEPKVDYKDDCIAPKFDPIEMKQKLLKDFQTSEDMTGALLSTQQPQQPGDWPGHLYGDAEIVVLGTGSSHPSIYRNVSGTLLRVPGWGSCLFDSGEGTLNTMRRMFSVQELRDILNDLKLIWISHLHADHHLGLTSVIKAWDEATNDARPLQKLAVISGAPMLHWLHEYSSVEDLNMSRILPFATTPLAGLAPGTSDSRLLEKQGTSLRVVTPRSSSQEDNSSTAEIISQLGLESLNTVNVNHCRGAQAISIAFNSGFKISYSGDCRPSTNFALIGRGSHVLIHEATFEDEMQTVAIAKKHSTVGEALTVATEMRAEVCLLTHFSQRYPTMPSLDVKVEPETSQAQVDRLDELLEVDEDGEQDLSLADNGPPNASINSSTLETDSQATCNRNSPGIDERDIGRITKKSGPTVLFAFDYMRLKLKDIPRLEMKQPILRRIYDLEIGNDLMVSIGEDGHDAKAAEVKETNVPNARERKRRKKQAMTETENGEASNPTFRAQLSAVGSI